MIKIEFEAKTKRWPWLAVLAVLITALPACTSVSRPWPVAQDRCWSDEEQSIERTRFFAKVEAQQALDAAARILQLAGKDEMRVERYPGSVSAEYHHQSTVYLFLVAHHSEVWDRWSVFTQPSAEGTWVCVQVTGQYFTDTFVLGAEPITNAVYPASTTERDPGKGFKPRAQAYPVNYDTFWERMEYLLGAKPKWAACPAGGPIAKHVERGRMEINPLCHVLRDEAPAQAGGR